MSEDFTSLAVAYLLDDLAPAARAEFEAQLAANPAQAAELKQIADTLGRLAEAETPRAPVAGGVRDAMLAAVLRRRHAPAFMHVVRRFAWPLAAAILLALNIGQALYHRQTAEREARPVPDAESESTTSAGSPSPHNFPAIPVSARNPRPLGARNGASPANTPSLQQTVTFSISQTTVTANTVASPPPENPAPQHGALELHNLPAVHDGRVLYLWARRAGVDAYEPVGEIPHQLYGGSGTINYQLRPGAGAPVHFLVTLEQPKVIPARPSADVVCAGP